MPRPRGRPPREQTATQTTPQKRARSPTTTKPASTSTSTPTRQSKRIKSTPVTSSAQKSTPQKSPFFHPDPEPDPGSDSDSDISEPESVIEDEASGYEDEDGSEDGVLEDDEEEDEDEDEDEDATPSSEEDGPRKRKGKRKPGRKVMITAKGNEKTVNYLENGEGEDENGGKKEKKGQELWRPGVKSKLAPGEAIFIPLPKAREAGKTPYQDHTVHPNTMAFLGELKENNEREWLKGN